MFFSQLFYNRSKGHFTFFDIDFFSYCMPNELNQEWGYITKIKLESYIFLVCIFFFLDSEGCESFCVNADMYGQQESITASESRTAAQSRTAAESRAAAESGTAAESRAAADSGTNNFVEGISAISTDLGKQ